MSKSGGEKARSDGQPGSAVLIIQKLGEPKWIWVVLLGITLVGAGLRLYRLGAYGFWRDEAEAVFTASAGFSAGIIGVLSGDVHAPLYFYLLHFWLPLVGRGEFGLRLFSALCGIAIVPLIYLAGQELFNRRTALLAAWIAAILPLHVACSRTTRMYTLLSLLGLLALISLYGALEKRRGRFWLVYMLAATLTIYTHYWGILWVGALSVSALFHLVWERRPKADWLAWVLAHLGITALLAPWLPVLWGQLQIQESVMGPWLPQQSRIANLLRLFNELTALAWPRGRPYLWIALLAMGTVSFHLRHSKARPPQPSAANSEPALEIRYPITPAHNLVVLGLFLPMLTGSFVLARAQGLTPSYVTMAVFPALCLLLALGLASLRRWPVVLLAIAGLSLLWLRADAGFYRGPISNLREIAQQVEQRAAKEDVVVIAPDYLAPTFNYYFHGTQPQASFPWLLRRVETMDWVGWAERRARAAEAIPATLDYIAQELGPSAKIWLIAPLAAYPHDPFFEQIRALKAALDRTYRLLEVNQDYRGPVETADILVYGSD